MSKRGADNYMTDQNWDQEEEEEEAGVFKQADRDTIKRRQIKKASRKVAADESKEEGTASTFKGFTGFSGFTKTNPSSAFGTLSSKPLTFANGSAPEATKPSLFSLAKTEDTKPDNAEIESAKNEQKPPPLTNGNGDSKSPKGSRSKYLHQLKSLNESVTRWIKEHVDKNPYCILTPIFKDYEKYLSDLEKKYPQQGKDKEGSVEETAKDDTKEKTDVSSPIESTPKFSFSTTDNSSIAASGGFAMTKTATSSSVTAPVFSFGNKSLSGNSGPLGVKPTSTETTSGIFGSTTTTSSSSSSTSTFSGFNFGAGSSGSSVFGAGASGTGFSFGDAAKKAAAGESKPESSSTADDEEYVPPKEAVAEVKEDDAIYSKRCKLFFKKSDQWKEKGVGNLHLKPCGAKTQLLIRADTNLGNILLNIMLSASLPLTRQGKNNVALVCVPNPAIDGLEESSMVPMLLRVKTAEDADELFEKLKENKS